MILIIGSITKERNNGFKQAKDHLLDTEKFHKIYGTKDIIRLDELRKEFYYLDDRQFMDLMLHLISYFDTVYVLKSWEIDVDARLLHDYAGNNGYKIIYSKKF